MTVSGNRIQRHMLPRAARATTAQRRPPPALLATPVAPSALSSPAPGMHPGSADARNGPKTSTSRQAYGLLAKCLGPGFNGPLIVTGRQLQRALADTDGVAATTPPPPSGNSTPTTAPAFPNSVLQRTGTEELLHHLRENVLPALKKTTRADFHISSRRPPCNRWAGGHGGCPHRSPCNHRRRRWKALGGPTTARIRTSTTE
jgi:hypothetical protein